MKEGFKPSEEDRQGTEEESNVEINKVYETAIGDMLHPPVAPSAANQIIYEGFRQSPDIAPEHVVILAEGIPSWLAAVDAWGADHISMYCEKEERWYRDKLDVMTPMTTFPTVAGISLADWTKSSNRYVLVQGSAQFCKKMIVGLQSIGLSDTDKIVITSNESCTDLSLSFKFLRLAHAKLGGATDTVTSVGFSKGCELSSKPVLAKGIPSTIKDHVSPLGQGRVAADPNSISFEPDPKGNILSSTTTPSLKQVSTCSFVVPSLFSKSNWTERNLSNSEMLSIVDTPVQITKAVDALSPKAFCLRTGRKNSAFQQVVPLKSLQEVTRLLFRFDSPKPKLHTIPIYDVMRLGPEIEGLSDIYEEINQARVAKNDDAVADSTMWDEAALEIPLELADSVNLLMVGRNGVHMKEQSTLLESMRFAHKKRYKKNVSNSFCRHMISKYDLGVYDEDLIRDEANDLIDQMDKLLKSTEAKRDLTEGRKAIGKADGASFWDWDNGSYPNFWRWQPEVQNDLRDGTKLWVYDDLLKKCTHKKQRIPKDPDIFALMVKKISKVRSRGYIGKLLSGSISSLTHFFAVPKGEDDIRMVYDLTASGLNAALWAPRFWMPTVSNILDCATDESWFGDVDAGEMFLNFPLDINIRKYCGVDMSWMREDGKTMWECWNRMAMGMRPSPFVTIRLLMWMMEIVVGDRKEPSNPFRWDYIVLNLPGSKKYDPTKPRVYKWNAKAECIACDCKFFCDDFRIVGPSRLLTKAATHKLETTMSYLGIQDATRKRRKITKRPGEWTGSIVLAVKDVGLFVTISQKKWKRVQNILNRWKEKFEEDEELPTVDYKQLECDLGFLVHVSMTYEKIKPFLRGFYLTMNSWRKGRDKEGWKLSNKAYQFFLRLGRKTSDAEDEVDAATWEDDKEAPSSVKAQPLMKEHLQVLLEMFACKEPVLRLVRGSAIYEALYIFGDASGLGFGSSWELGDQLGYRYGVWGLKGEDTSSNFRELLNLVETLERNGLNGDLTGREIFLFTDNSTAESVVHKGSSTSPELYKLMVRLYKLPMRFLCSINVIHVAGTRMIAQGTDGLSRGDLLEGVLKGESMLSFVPLHESVLDRQPSIKAWVDSWAGDLGNEVEWLKTDDWFERGHDISGYTSNIDGRTIPTYKKGTFVWTPPPAAARVALEEIRQSRQKRQDSSHIIVVPKLMSPEWQRQLFKTADLVVIIPTGHPHWPKTHHESLTLAICFPYLRSDPWELKGTPLMGRMARELHKLLQDDPSSGRDLLSQLCAKSTTFNNLSIFKLRKLLSGRWKHSISS